MPESLLLQLETANELTQSLDYIENLMQVDVAKVASAIDGQKGLAQPFEKLWQRIVIEVASGKTTELQTARPELVGVFEKRLSLLKDTHAFATWLTKRCVEGVPDPDNLLPEIVGMERLKARVFDQWQTAEDLEDLAARDYPLTTVDLDKIGPLRQPPASYYDLPS